MLRKFISLLTVICMLGTMFAVAEEVPSVSVDMQETEEALETTVPVVEADPIEEEEMVQPSEESEDDNSEDIRTDMPEDAFVEENDEEETCDHYWVSDGINSWKCENCGNANTCKHSDWEIEWTGSQEDYDNATDCGDGTHQYTVTPYTCFSCDECGLSYAYWYGESTIEVESHDWSDDGETCNTCGATNTCTHENAKYEYRDIERESDATDNGDGTHSYTARDTIWYKCPECDYEYYVEADTTYTRTEKHDWDEDGTECYECGAVNSCTHENAKIEETYAGKVDSAIDNGDGTHSYTARDTYWYECPDCDYEYYVEADTTYTRTEKHNWDEDGTECEDCGAVNNCTHERAQRDYTYADSEDAAIDNGNGTHSYTARNVTVYECPDCGYRYSVEADETYTKIEAHNWDEDGTECYECGALNSCAHSNIVYEYVYTSQEGKSVDNGDGTHSYTARDEIGYTCLDCGYSYVVEADTTYEITDKHSWKSNGICYFCGAVNMCEHESMATHCSFDSDNASVSGSTSHTHTLSGYYIYETYCSDCGQEIGVTQGTELAQKTAQHEFTNGVCTVCGYSNKCVHKRTRQSFDVMSAKYIDIEGLEAHGLQSTIVVCTTCTACGETISKEIYKSDISCVQPHNYNSDGKCYVCRHENTCKHLHTEENSFYSNAGACTAVDSTYHSEPVIVQTETYCKDCGQWFGTESSRQETKIGEHDYCDGICTSCGYENTCQHTKTETVIDYRMVTLNVTATQHTVLKQPITRTVCSACGEELSSKLNGKATEETENHSFSANEVYNCCSVCGYVYDGTAVICNHKSVKVAAKQPTCTEAGYTAGTKCSKCGITLTGMETIPATGHTEVIDEAVAPTCTETGLTEGSHCSVCKAVFTAQEVVPAVGHTEVVDPAVEPTCSATGLTEGSHCSVCGEIIIAQETVDKIPHTFGPDYICTACGAVSEITSIDLGGDIEMAKGETYTLPMTYEPAAAANKVTFTSTNPKVATVSAYGVVKAVSTGYTCIYAQGGDGYDYIGVNVNAAVTKVALNRTSATLEIGETLELYYYYIGYTSSLKWSSTNINVATVDEDSGLITAVGSGTATIKLTVSNGKAASCKITVAKAATLTSVSVNGNSTVYLPVGDTYGLSARVLPSDADAAVTFKTSSAKVASVDASGLVTAKAKGTATITVTATQGKVKKTATMKVMVVDPSAPALVSFYGLSMIYLDVGDEFRVDNTVEPYTNTAVLTWTSSNKAAAIVDESGNITAVGAGTTKITLTAVLGKTKKSTSVTVKVTDPRIPTSLYLDCGKTVTVYVGEQLPICAYTNPDTAEGEITWKSSNTKVITVDEDGIVTPLKTGTATVTATIKYNGVTKSASVKITVASPATLTGVSMNMFTGTQELKVGDELPLIAAVQEGPECNAEVTWKSSAPTIVSVDPDGRIHALKTGTATITLTAMKGKTKKTATLKVKVIA